MTFDLVTSGSDMSGQKLYGTLNYERFVALVQEFEEKTIKISQKPNGEKGFGFTIGGGKEHCSPIVIEKVSLGLCLTIIKFA